MVMMSVVPWQQDTSSGQLEENIFRIGILNPSHILLIVSLFLCVWLFFFSSVVFMCGTSFKSPLNRLFMGWKVLGITVYEMYVRVSSVGLDVQYAVTDS